MRESLRIVAVCMLAAVGYGILHDLITAHVCVEYFTEWHPQIVSSRNPVVLALVWGVVATWWVGALLGMLLAIVARAGRRYPKLALSQLARPIAYVLGIAGVAALALGLAGYWSVCAWGAPPFVSAFALYFQFLPAQLLQARNHRRTQRSHILIITTRHQTTLHTTPHRFHQVQMRTITR